MLIGCVDRVCEKGVLIGYVDRVCGQGVLIGCTLPL